VADGVVQVSIISPGEVETAESAKFYELLGISDPASFTPAEPPATAAASTAKIWAVEYTCEGSDAPSGWPLVAKGEAPRADTGDLLDAVCRWIQQLDYHSKMSSCICTLTVLQFYGVFFCFCGLINLHSMEQSE
jgi:hypothetical protein